MKFSQAKLRKIKVYCCKCHKLRIIETYYQDTYDDVVSLRDSNSYVCSDHVK